MRPANSGRHEEGTHEAHRRSFDDEARIERQARCGALRFGAVRFGDVRSGTV